MARTSGDTSLRGRGRGRDRGLAMEPVGEGRRRPTASARRHARQHIVSDEAHAEAVVGHIVEDAHAEPSARAEASTSEAAQPSASSSAQGFPGGPEDTSILSSFATHVAHSIWAGEVERPTLKCHSHGGILGKWVIEHPGLQQRITDSGLGSLCSSTYSFCNKAIVSAMVERWHPETNTFHLPVGEMTITLDDVVSILDIRVDGLPIPYTQPRREAAIELIHTTLGVSEAAAMAAFEGGGVTFDWLRDHFRTLPEDATAAQIDCAARAYLLYVLGCTLFVDKTGMRVSVLYLMQLRDLRTVRDYAWGAAALAFLYRQLGHASRRDVRQIAGYLTLLEAWTYEHIPQFQPGRNTSYADDLPRVRRWLPRREAGDTDSAVQSYREALDDLTADDLCDLYNNDSIFDKFECCLSGDGLHFASGSYSNLFRVFSRAGSEEGSTLEASKNPNRKQPLQTSSKPGRSLTNLTRGHTWRGHDNSSSDSNVLPWDLTSKLLRLAWHPTTNLIACAAANSLYMYYA